MRKSFSDESSINKKVKDAWKNYQKQQKSNTKKTVKRSTKKK